MTEQAMTQEAIAFMGVLVESAHQFENWELDRIRHYILSNPDKIGTQAAAFDTFGEVVKMGYGNGKLTEENGGPLDLPAPASIPHDPPESMSIPIYPQADEADDQTMAIAREAVILKTRELSGLISDLDNLSDGQVSEITPAVIQEFDLSVLKDTEVKKAEPQEVSVDKTKMIVYLEDEALEFDESTNYVSFFSPLGIYTADEEACHVIPWTSVKHAQVGQGFNIYYDAHSEESWQTALKRKGSKDD